VFGVSIWGGCSVIAHEKKAAALRVLRKRTVRHHFSEAFRTFQTNFRTSVARLSIVSIGPAWTANAARRETEDIGMTRAKRDALKAIAAGGLLAGALDLAQASILFGTRVPFSIAAGLLGRSAFRGGAGTYALGLFLHFFIAVSAAVVYYAASRKLTFLKEHPLVCGLFYGGAVEEVMNLIVLPLSALHARGPYKLRDLLLGLLVHMVVVGLPISFSIRRFGELSEPLVSSDAEQATL
jgi:hypothetical protein